MDVYISKNKIYNAKNNKYMFSFDTIKYLNGYLELADNFNSKSMLDISGIYEYCKYAKVIKFYSIPKNFILCFPSLKVIFNKSITKKYTNICCHISNFFFFFLIKK